MEIDKEALQKSFKLYDKDVIVEIIDLFFEEYPERVKSLEEAINQKDYDLLKTTAHSLKGVISHFHAEEPRSLAKELEDKGTNHDMTGVESVFRQLKEKADKMLEELKEIKKEYQ